MPKREGGDPTKTEAEQATYKVRATTNCVLLQLFFVTAAVARCT